MGNEQIRFDVKSQRALLNIFGRGHQFYPVILELTDRYDKVFHFQFPCTVLITSNVCGITTICMKDDTHVINFRYPQYKNGELIFEAAAEHVRDENDTLYKVINISETGLFCSKGATAELDSTIWQGVSYPLNFILNTVDVEFAHKVRHMPSHAEYCRDTIYQLKRRLYSGIPFEFSDIIHLLETHLAANDFENINIPGIVKMSRGEVIYATSARSDHVVSISFDKAKYLSGDILMCQTTLAPDNVQTTFSMSVNNPTEDVKQALYKKATDAIEAFRQDIQAYNRARLKKETPGR